MSQFSTIIISERGPGVAQISMARPAVFNAFDEVMIEELDEAFAIANQDSSVRVIVLTGEGKHFSAGADLQWMKRASTATQEWNLLDARKFARMLYRIESSKKPTIARIQGVALGGGVGLTCACDIAIAADNASFAVSEAKFGILPSVIGPYVTNSVGKKQAKRLALTTTRITAEEALRINMIQQIVSLEILDQAIDSTASELLSSGPKAIEEIKNLYAQLSMGPINEDVLELTAQTISRVRGTDEAREGFDAFLNKRSPNWIPKV